MPTVDFTLEDIKQVIDERLDVRLGNLDERLDGLDERLDRVDDRFTTEREHTRKLVQEGVEQVISQFNSFIVDNFNPAIEAIDQRFERLEDRADHLAGDVTDLRIDARHIKQTLRGPDFPAASIVNPRTA